MTKNELYKAIESEVSSSTMDLINELIHKNEDYAMLARENKNMAEALEKLGYTPEQVSDICNGAI